MALLLRMGGIPTRVVTGFSPGGYSKSKRAWIVRDTDAHSWVEAWFDEWGWVTFDPTPAGTPGALADRGARARPGERAPIAATRRPATPARRRARAASAPDLLGTQAGPAARPRQAREGGGPPWWWLAPAAAARCSRSLAWAVLRWRRRSLGPAAALDRAVAELEAALRRAGRPAAARRRCGSSSSASAARRRPRPTCGRCAPAATRRRRRRRRPAAAARCAASWRAAAAPRGGCARSGRCRRGGRRAAVGVVVAAASRAPWRRVRRTSTAALREWVWVAVAARDELTSLPTRTRRGPCAECRVRVDVAIRRKLATDRRSPVPAAGRRRSPVPATATAADPRRPRRDRRRPGPLSMGSSRPARRPAAQPASAARRDWSRISDRIRSSRGSADSSTCVIAAATAGWRSAISACIWCATAR